MDVRRRIRARVRQLRAAFLKWQFYLKVLAIEDVGIVDSFLTFLSGFVLTISPGKVGEVFKSFVLFETHGVPMPKTAPIVVAERITDLIGVIVLIVIGSLGFRGGALPAIVGTALVVILLGVIASRRASTSRSSRSSKNSPDRFAKSDRSSNKLTKASPSS